MVAKTLSIKIAPKPYIIGSLGPTALKYGSFEGKGMCHCSRGLRALIKHEHSLPHRSVQKPPAKRPPKPQQQTQDKNPKR